MSEQKPLTLSEKIDAGAQQVLNKSYNPEKAVLNVGKGASFSASNHNINRYLSYGTDVYGKLGFDPFDNKLEKKYVENTSAVTDIKRAWTGAWKLAGIGFSDTFALGAGASATNYVDFGKTMETYSSSRGGTSGFLANTMLSSGYTAGIIAGIAAEEIGIGLVTGGVGLLGTGGIVGTQLARGFSKLNQLNKVDNTLHAATQLADINKARTFLGKTGDWAKTHIIPGAETRDFIKNLNKIEDLPGLQQTALGAGAVVRDMRKILMTNSESKLEANMAREEFKTAQVEKWHKENPGKELTDAEFNEIKDNSEKVYSDTYMANVGLIYLTNAITFDNAFKNMRLSNNWISAGKNGMLRVTGSGTANVSVNALEKSLGTSLRSWGTKTFKPKNLWTGLKKATPGAAMQGVQELGQDVISTSAIRYHSLNNKQKQVEGSYFDQVWNAGKEKVFSVDGFSTFMSGALMGAFASPVGLVTSQATKALSTDGISNAYKKYFDAEAYSAQKKTEFELLQKKADVLTEIFKDPKAYVDFITKPAFTQSALQEEMLKASERKDKKQFEDLRETSFAQGIESMLKYGIENEYIDHLDKMSEGFDAEEMNQAFGRTDVNADNIDEFRKKLKDRGTVIKNYRKVYDKINQDIINPYSLKGLDTTDEKNMGTFLNYHAFENLKRELLFSHGKLANWATRMTEVKDELAKELDFSATDTLAMLDKNSLSQSIALLKAEVSANKGLNVVSAENKESVVKAEKKLEALTAYSAALTKFSQINKAMNVDNSDIETDAMYAEKQEEVYDELLSAFKMYSEANGTYSEATAAVNRKQFDKIYDYLEMSEDTENFQALINTLADPSSASKFIDEHKAMLERKLNNKQDDILGSLQAFEERKQSSKMLEILHDSGIFFNMQELDDLIKKGVVPSEFYDLSTHELASPEQVAKAEEILKAFYKNLKGLRNTGDTRNKVLEKKYTRKQQNDNRTVKQILAQYGITLDTTYDLSDPVVKKRFLKKLDASKHLLFIEKQLLDQVKNADISVRFTLNGDQPVSFKENTVIIDLRFAGSEYINSTLSIETMLLSAMTQTTLANNLNDEANSGIKEDVVDLMKQAADAYKSQYNDEQFESLAMFSDPAVFLSEALNNPSFQEFLRSIQDKNKSSEQSLSKSYMTQLNKLIKYAFEPNLVPKAKDIVDTAVDNDVIDNINDQATEEGNQEETVDEEPVVVEPTLSTEEQLIKAKALLASINNALENAKGLLNFRKRGKLINDKNKVLIEIDELSAKINREKTITPDLSPVGEPSGPTSSAVDESTSIDENGDVIINEFTPFDLLPEELQNNIESLYISNVAELNIAEANKTYTVEINAILAASEQKDMESIDESLAEIKATLSPFLQVSFNGKKVVFSQNKSVTLSDADYVKIKTLLENNYDYQKLIADYNKSVEQQSTGEVLQPDDESLSDEELRIYNADATAKNKELARQRNLERRREALEQTRSTSGKRRVTAQQRADFLEAIQRVTGVDFESLTPEELNSLIDRLMNSSESAPFRILDVLTYIKDKKEKLRTDSELQLVRIVYEDELAKIKDAEQRKIAEAEYQKEIQAGIAAENDQALSNYAEIKQKIKAKKSFRIINRAGKPAFFKPTLKDLKVFAKYNNTEFGTMDLETLTQRFYIAIETAKYNAANLKLTEIGKDLQTDTLTKIIDFNKSKSLYPVLANAINKQLNKAGARFTLQESKTPSVGIYDLNFDKVINRKAPQTTYRKNIEWIEDNMYQFDVDSFAEATVILYFAKGGKVNQKLINQIVKGKQERAGKLSLVNKNSKHKTFDGFFDAIGQDAYEDYRLENSPEAGGNAVERIILNYNNATEMVNSFTEEQKSRYAEPMSEDEFVFNELNQQDADNYTNYILSKTFAIETGDFEDTAENIAELTPGEKLVYDVAKSRGLYFKENEAKSKTKSTEEAEDDFFGPKKELTSVEQKGTELLGLINVAVNKNVAIDRQAGFAIISNVLSSSPTDLILAAAVYSISTMYGASDISTPQKDTYIQMVKERFAKGLFNDQFAIVDNEVYMITKASESEIMLLTVDGITSVTMKLTDFLNKLERVAEAGETFTKRTVDTNAPADEINELKTTIKDFFGNFTKAISEVENSQTLNDDILEQLKNCK